MKISDAINEIVKRADEDIENEEYTSRAKNLFIMSLSELLFNETFDEKDYPGLFMMISVQDNMIKSPDSQQIILKIYKLLNAFCETKRPVIVFDKMIDFISFAESVFSDYDERIGLIQIADFVYSNKMITAETGLTICYIRKLNFNDRTFYSRDTQTGTGEDDDNNEDEEINNGQGLPDRSDLVEKDLEESYSTRFLTAVIERASQTLITEIKGKVE